MHAVWRVRLRVHVLGARPWLSNVAANVWLQAPFFYATAHVNDSKRIYLCPTTICCACYEKCQLCSQSNWSDCSKVAETYSGVTQCKTRAVQSLLSSVWAISIDLV